MNLPSTRVAHWAAPVGRALFALIFIFSSLNHFGGEMIGYAESNGVPLANIAVPFSGIMVLMGGLSVLLGYRARWGAVLLILFLLPVTFMMHDFWTRGDAAEYQNQMVHFMKNLSMLGGAILIACLGAGPVSIDERQSH
jgi:putative oxidoreductase